MAWTCADSKAATSKLYKVTGLVSDGNVPAKRVDDRLLNPWGTAYTPTGLFWVANNAAATSTMYNGKGTPSALTVSIPTYPGNADGASPTGVVYNPTSRFIVKQSAKTGPAQFLFASEDGTISGWNPDVSRTSAVRMVDRSSYQANYKGLAIAHSGSGDYLYAANFRTRSIDVFDNKFRPATLNGTFHDETMPDTFAPVNIRNIGGKLFVTFAQQDDQAQDAVAGDGLGFVDVFNPDGTFLRRLASNGTLNAPWGMALAPRNFGRYSNDLLVGNSGDGTISAFNPVTGAFKGRLKDRSGKVITIDGLEDLSFGNGLAAGKTNSLYFTAGPNDGADGRFGVINMLPPTVAPLSLSAAVVPEPASVGILLGAGTFFLLRRRVSCSR